MALLLAVGFMLQLVTSQGVDLEPSLRSAVEGFFATQEAEDAGAYLALWSANAKRPSVEQLKYVFDSGDDSFADITVTAARVAGDTARVRVHVMRVRTATGPNGEPRTFRSPVLFALSFVREGGEWKLVREGSPLDELAAALIETDGAAARGSLLQAEKDLVNARLVEAIWRRADPLAQQGQYRAAQVIYERSLEVARAAGDRKAEGQALQNVANSLYFLKQFEGALALYEQRLALERDIGNDDGVASALLGIATIRYSANEYGAALETYREALAIQERLDDQVLVSTTLISTGNVLYLQGDYDGAIRDYRRAEVIKRKYLDLVGATTALEGLARVYAAQGDYASALAALSGVLDERRKRNDGPRQAIALQSIGEIHLRLGNLDQARSAFAEARGHFEKAGDTAAAGRVLQGTALTELVAGRLPAGEKAYSDSVAACSTAADQECVARAQAGLGFALSAQQKFDDAIAWYRKAIAGFTALSAKDAVARAQIGLAEALSGKRDHAAALEQAANARQTAVALNSDDILWRALVSQARAERKLGRTEALGAAKAAVLAVRRMSAAALERPQQPVPRDTTAAFATTAVLQAEAGDADAAFETMEEMRGHALRLWLAPHDREIARDMTDEERAEERRLAVELTTLLVRREREASLPKPDAKRLEQLDAAISSAIGARDAARARLFSRLPELPVWRGLAPAATAKDLDELLGDLSTLLLAFTVDEHDIAVIVASRPTADGPVTLRSYAVAVERQFLGEHIGRMLDDRSLSDHAAWQKTSAPVFDLLPADVRHMLESARRLIVLPDDLIWRVPFEALPIEGGYLADRTVITYAASVSAALRSRTRPVDAPSSLTVFAAPQLAAQVVDGLKQTAPSWRLRAPEASMQEASVIADASTPPPARVVTGADATAGAFHGALTATSLLHVGAPFRVNSASPLFSPILFAEPTGDQQRRSRIDLRDLFNVRAAARVITLSDPAALSMRDAAASVPAVEWAWHAAGASDVMLRRWGGSEEHASALLGRVYEELRRGKTAADALHIARAAMRAKPEGRAPAAWAGWLVLSAR